MLLSSLFESDDPKKKVKEGLKMGDYGHEKEKAAIAAAPKPRVAKIDMTGKVCKNCHKGRYQETSQHDDMDGVLHCPKCGDGTKRWVAKVKEEFTGYWKAKDKAPPGKKMVGAAESVSEEGNPTDKITMDVPLFIRALEYAKEDAKSDMDLHDLTERAIKLMQEHDYLCMDNYDTLVGGQATGGEELTKEGRFDEPLSGWRITAKNGESVIGPKFDSKDEAQKYLMTKLFHIHHDFKIVYYGKNVGEGKIKGADGKACWDGYRYNGTKNGKDSCVKVTKSK